MFGDKKGPMGKGEKTGRGFGYCNGFDVPGYTNERSGMGIRLGRGFGCGRGSGIVKGRNNTRRGALK